MAEMAATASTVVLRPTTRTAAITEIMIDRLHWRIKDIVSSAPVH